MKLVMQKNIILNKTVHCLLEPHIIKAAPLQTISFLDASEAKKIFNTHLKLSEGKPFCVLLDLTGDQLSPDPEVFKLWASPEFCRSRLAVAVLANSFPGKSMATMFVNKFQPSSPLKIFKKEEELKAVEWLRSFIK